ncbi:MAG TPA: hypothetical protein VHA09_00690, partial [Nitrososphaera sp.]|nr:hypothetical protein [Nitrososphaera sp.]
VPAAWTPQAIPFNEYLAYLAPLLAACVPSRADWLLSLVTDAYTLASHVLITPTLCKISISALVTIDYDL